MVEDWSNFSKVTNKNLTVKIIIKKKLNVKGKESKNMEWQYKVYAT